jgi:hypothetical protein
MCFSAVKRIEFSHILLLNYLHLLEKHVYMIINLL